MNKKLIVSLVLSIILLVSISGCAEKQVIYAEPKLIVLTIEKTVVPEEPQYKMLSKTGTLDTDMQLAILSTNIVKQQNYNKELKNVISYYENLIDSFSKKVAEFNAKQIEDAKKK